MRSVKRLFLVLPLMLAGCVTTGSSAMQAESSAKAQWQDQGISNYRFTVERQCFCQHDYTRAVRIVVDNGKIVEARFADDAEVVPAGIRAELRTMAQWLTYIETLEAKKPHRLQVQLDAETGHLIKLEVDHHPRIADDELTVIISDFSAD